MAPGIEKVNKSKNKFGKEEEYKCGQVDLCMKLPDRDIKPVASSTDLELGERFGMETQT